MEEEEVQVASEVPFSVTWIPVPFRYRDNEIYGLNNLWPEETSITGWTVKQMGRVSRGTSLRRMCETAGEDPSEMKPIKR